MKATTYFFISMLIFSLGACSGGSDESADVSALELEKQKVQLEQEKLRLEEEKHRMELERIEKENEIEKEKQNQIKRAENERLESKFRYNSYAYVVTERAYFHSQPDITTKSGKKYLTNGDACDVLRTRNGFGYVNFYNEYVDKTTSGWIDLRDLEPYRAD